jgi:hypothetical protein
MGWETVDDCKQIDWTHGTPAQAANGEDGVISVDSLKGLLFLGFHIFK